MPTPSRLHFTGRLNQHTQQLDQFCTLSVQFDAPETTQPPLW